MEICKKNVNERLSIMATWLDFNKLYSNIEKTVFLEIIVTVYLNKYFQLWKTGVMKVIFQVKSIVTQAMDWLNTFTKGLEIEKVLFLIKNTRRLFGPGAA